MRCEHCNTDMIPLPVKKGRRPWYECPSCLLYNAAVAAQKAAAAVIAKEIDPTATDAWLNEHVVFAWINGPDGRRVCDQVGTKEEAAPFAALTGSTRKVTKFWKTRDVTADARSGT
jgi:hypothetical protein